MVNVISLALINSQALSRSGFSMCVHVQNTPPPPGAGGKYQPMLFGGINMKGEKKKEENVQETGVKTKVKGKLKLKS